MSAGIPTRILREVGTRAWLRVYWGEDCPNSYGLGGTGIHNAMIHLLDTSHLEDWDLGGDVADYPRDAWPEKCDHCDAAWTADRPRVPCDCGSPRCMKKRHPDEPIFHIHHRRMYQPRFGGELRTRDTFEPGDMFWGSWYPCAEGGECIYRWTNCDGRHLFCVLPNGHHWDIGARASNCDMTDNNTHRCWVLHGDPDKGELVHVDKVGHTCTAGAGSIDTPRHSSPWHGFLHGGKLVKC